MDVAAIHKALGHPQRYALFLDILGGGGRGSFGVHLDSNDEACCVVDLTARHALAQSTISHHLRILLSAGLLQQERRSTFNLYRVNEATWDSFRQHVMSLPICHDVDEKSAAFRVLIDE